MGRALPSVTYDTKVTVMFHLNPKYALLSNGPRAAVCDVRHQGDGYVSP